jgi:hypothetical protein
MVKRLAAYGMDCIPEPFRRNSQNTCLMGKDHK